MDVIQIDEVISLMPTCMMVCKCVARASTEQRARTQNYIAIHTLLLCPHLTSSFSPPRNTIPHHRARRPTPKRGILCALPPPPPVEPISQDPWTRRRLGGHFFQWDLVAHASEDADKSGDGVLPQSLFLFNSTMKLGRFLAVCLGWRAFLL
jgi:hypothetical protein